MSVARMRKRYPGFRHFPKSRISLRSCGLLAEMVEMRMPKLISVSFIVALWIFALDLPGSSVAQTRQSQAAFETAIRDHSSSPYVILITVVDDRTGQSNTGCTLAPFLPVAIYIEKWGPLPKSIAKTDPRLKEAEEIALENTSHVFHFSSQAALDNLPFRHPDACAAIKRGSRARIADIIGKVILGPFTEGPRIVWSSCPPPVLPPEAQADKEGATTIALLVDPDGNLRESKLSGDSGSAPRDEAIRTALSACKFKPRTVDDVPVPEAVWMTISIGSRSSWLKSARSAPR